MPRRSAEKTVGLKTIARSVRSAILQTYQHRANARSDFVGPHEEARTGR